jgi:hypothetical protein
LFDLPPRLNIRERASIGDVPIHAKMVEQAVCLCAGFFPRDSPLDALHALCQMPQLTQSRLCGKIHK